MANNEMTDNVYYDGEFTDIGIYTKKKKNNFLRIPRNFVKSFRYLR